MNKHAIIIGGSMAGLLTARVLSKHFEKITLLERDAIHNKPESRKGQPHTRHLHGLLAEGFRVMTQYFPDLDKALLDGGAIVEDMTKMMRWYAFGGYRKPFSFGTKGALMSRPFLEWLIRERVQALTNVNILDEHSVESLLTDSSKTTVQGVRLINRKRANSYEDLRADLVVDSSGRGSMTGKWLSELGYAKPKENTVTVNAGYATRLYERNPNDPEARAWVFITPEAPIEKRMGGAFAIEGNRWIVSLGGWHGEHASANEAEFIAFAKSLPAPDVYNIISHNKALSDIVLHKFPSSLRRHYEKLERFPEGFLVLGDALCSFNPLYGQGMTSAALQAEALDKLLDEQTASLAGIAKRFFKRAAKIIDIPWQLAVGEDFRFPETKGKKAPGTDFINSYVTRVHRATHHDPVIGNAFIRVMNLMSPPASLFKPKILLRVFRAGSKQNQEPAHSASNQLAK